MLNRTVWKERLEALDNIGQIVSDEFVLLLLRANITSSLGYASTWLNGLVCGGKGWIVVLSAIIAILYNIPRIGSLLMNLCVFNNSVIRLSH